MDRVVAAAAVATAALLLVVGYMVWTGSPAEQWSITLQGSPATQINQSVYAQLVNCNKTLDEVNGVPLEVVLYYYGLYPVTAVTIDDHVYDWGQEAYDNSMDIPLLVLPDGRIYDGNKTYRASQINVTLAEKPAHASLELPASIMYSLGGEGTEGLISGHASQIVLYYVDAFGYYRYESEKGNGTIKNITALGEPLKATCVYPSVSKVNSRALVTGVPSNLSQGDFNIAIPDVPTIFDRLKADGKSAVWVGGAASPVLLGDYVSYNPDSNHNGRESDEVADAAIRQYQQGTNLIIVHFKDTDTKAHAFGPFSAEASDAVRDADGQIGRIDAVLQPGTVAIVYADHGGHNLASGGGNHGTLIPGDMYVPIVVHRVG